MPDDSVLADDRVTYRVIARAGTVRPFILPADSLYNLAELQPAGLASYVLVPAVPSQFSSGRIARAYATRAPEEFRLLTAWPDWRLYAHEPENFH